RLEVWAAAASPAMVERLRAKPGAAAVHAVVGNMAELDLGSGAPERFAVVLCAYNTLFNLTHTDAQRRSPPPPPAPPPPCLAGVAGLLAPEGRLVVEAFVPPPGSEGEAAVSAVEPRHIGLDEVVVTVSRTDPGTPPGP